ncbi:hypothetical protein BpHYR1_012714, partial [Brachionus plicatilis]
MCEETAGLNQSLVDSMNELYNQNILKQEVNDLKAKTVSQQKRECQSTGLALHQEKFTITRRLCAVGVPNTKVSKARRIVRKAVTHASAEDKNYWVLALMVMDNISARTEM